MRLATAGDEIDDCLALMMFANAHAATAKNAEIKVTVYERI